MDRNTLPSAHSIMENLEFLRLHEFSLILNSSHDIDRILQDSTQKIEEMFEADGCHILFARKIRDDLHLETVIHDGTIPFPQDVDETKGISGNTFNTGQIMVVCEAETDPRVTRGMFEAFEHHSLVSAPILIKDQVMGAIVIYSHIPHHYSERDGDFLLILGTHLALAVENAQLLLQIRRSASLDALTGAFNRGYFRDKLEDFFNQQNPEPLSLLMMDVNDLKIINDTYGHTAGDYILREITDVLKKNVRERDSVSRYGGDEFAIILPGADAEEALQIATRIEQATLNHSFVFGEEEIPVTLSWGYITTQDHEFNSINDLINGADRGLYKMKKQKTKLSPPNSPRT